MVIWSNIVVYSKTCVRQPPLKLTLVVDVEWWLSYKGTCHVILLAKLHDMYLYKTDNFFHINHYFKSSQRWLSYTGFTVQPCKITRQRCMCMYYFLLQEHELQTKESSLNTDTLKQEISDIGKEKSGLEGKISELR